MCVKVYVFVDLLLTVNKCFVVDQLYCQQGNGLNTTFCGLARDMLLSNQDREKLNFDTKNKLHYTYITHIYFKL